MMAAFALTACAAGERAPMLASPAASAEVAPPAASSATAKADAEPARPCASPADELPREVNRGPQFLGPGHGEDVEAGPAVRGTLVALEAPAGLDVHELVSFAPFAITGAYKDVVNTNRALRGKIVVELTLDAVGKTTNVNVLARGFPVSFVAAIRDQLGDTTYRVCSPLAQPATVKATIRLEPRTLQAAPAGKLFELTRR